MHGVSGMGLSLGVMAAPVSPWAVTGVLVKEPFVVLAPEAVGAQHRVCLRELRELGVGKLTVLVPVWMVPHGQPVVGLLNLLLSGVWRHAQDRIQVCVLVT